MPNPEDDITITLYDSTFWTNVDNFRDSGATPVSWLLLFTGIGQPCIKAILLPLFLFPFLKNAYLKRVGTGEGLSCSLRIWNRFRNLGFLLTPSPKAHTRMLLAQEITAKLTNVASNVGVIMLNCVTVSFALNRDGRITADAITDTLWGTELYMAGGMCSVLAVVLLRIRCTPAFLSDEEVRVIQVNDQLNSGDNSRIGSVSISREKKIANDAFKGNEKRGSVSDHLALCPSEEDDNLATEISNKTAVSAPLLPNAPVLVLSPPRELSWQKEMLHILFLVLTVSFYIPSFMNGMIKFDYTGSGAAYLEGENPITLHFMDLPVNLYNGTPQKVFATINAALFYINNIICPFLSIFFSAILRHKLHSNPRKILFYLRIVFPFAMLETAVIALCFAAPAMALISTWIFDGNALCAAVLEEADEECMKISGTLLSGAYWCVAACVFTNAYVGWTLYECGVEEFEMFSPLAEEDKTRGDDTNNNVGYSIEEGSVTNSDKEGSVKSEKSPTSTKGSRPSDWLLVNPDTANAKVVARGNAGGDFTIDTPKHDEEGKGNNSPADFMDYKKLANETPAAKVESVEEVIESEGGAYERNSLLSPNSKTIISDLIM